MIGALLGDVIKGPLKGEYPESWERGIQLHRSIDAYTDSHPLIIACYNQFPKKYRRFCGIMLDVAFDHFLNKHWRQFHPQTIDNFATDIYQLLIEASLPRCAQSKSSRIIEYDLLSNYQHWDFILNVIAAIGQRLSVANPLADSGNILTELYPQIAEVFFDFYPLLQQFVLQKRLNGIR